MEFESRGTENDRKIYAAHGLDMFCEACLTLSPTDSEINQVHGWIVRQETTGRYGLLTERFSLDTPRPVIREFPYESVEVARIAALFLLSEVSL